MDLEINAWWLRKNLCVPPEEEEERINEGSRLMPGIDLCRDQIYRIISEENIVTVKTIFYSTPAGVELIIFVDTVLNEEEFKFGIHIFLLSSESYI